MFLPKSPRLWPLLIGCAALFGCERPNGEPPSAPSAPAASAAAAADEAATCIQAFRPKIVCPYHYRGSDLSVLKAAIAGQEGIEVREREWY